MRDIEVRFIKEDLRPPFWLNDVARADFQHVKAQRSGDGATFLLQNVSDFNMHQCWPLPDMRLDRVDTKKL
ncbi:MAG TPA: hypothetical protein VE135_24865 [Pyrinomonadaceae bacterium]|nr:hypothetical protein [Pyrinomonadaceae bacterium]